MRRLWLTIALLGVGCGGNSGGGGGQCASRSIVLLSWTVKQQPPTADQGCKGIDSLAVELQGCEDISIEPIPCINGERWEYNDLPGGPTLVILSALDAQKQVIAQGLATVTLEPTVPATPAAIDLE
jgi:hypothetical protein